MPSGPHLDPPQSGCGEQGVEFGDVTLPAAGRVVHVHVHQRSETGPAGLSDEEIDDGDTAAIVECCSAVPQDSDRLGVAPVMQGVLEYVEIRWRDRLEEVAADGGESCRLVGREDLLGIGALAVAAERRRERQAHSEMSVGAERVAVPAS